MIDQPQDPLAASLRLQLEGDIRPQFGDYELVYDNKCAILQPLQRKPIGRYFVVPTVLLGIMISFFVALCFVPGSIWNVLVFLVFLGVIILFFGFAFVQEHRDFARHRLLPPLLRAGVEQVDLPQINASMPVESLLAVYFIRLPLKTSTKDKGDRPSGTLEQAGLIHRDGDGGVSLRVLVTHYGMRLPHLNAGLQELAESLSIQFIEQTLPWSKAVDSKRIDAILPKSVTRRFTRTM